MDAANVILLIDPKIGIRRDQLAVVVAAMAFMPQS
jgi:hypothetical protein